jgi:dihydropyrimidine dehydrogenase (NAD+) subunit PreA
LLGLNNIELITDRPLEVNLREIAQVKRDWPDRAMVVSLMVPCEEELEGDPAAGRGHRRRRHRAEFRLPARHERARHGLGGGPGARIHRDGHALVQAEHAMPVIVKLTPNITDIRYPARAARRAARMRSLINTCPRSPRSISI